MTKVEVSLPSLNIPDKALDFFQRVLGPIAEASDFLSDKIRFYRWKSSLATMKRAQEIASEHGITPKEIPLKILVPLLEKSSLEDEGSELVEKWAMLLANASSDPNSVHAIYVEILAHLRSEDVSTIEKIISVDFVNDVNRPSSGDDKTRTWTIRLTAMQDFMYNSTKNDIIDIMREKEKSEYHGNLKDFIFALPRKHKKILVENAGVNFLPFEEDDVAVWNRDVNFASLDVLESCGLIVRRQYRYSVLNGEAFLTIVVPTPLGIGFVSACRGDEFKKTV